MRRRCFLLLLAGLLFLAGSAASCEEIYEDGVYRGFYYSGGVDQVAVQFEIKNGLFRSFVLRSLRDPKTDYLTQYGSDARTVRRAFSALASYLAGKPPAAVAELYAPEQILAEADVVSSATTPYHYLISAVYDGLSRRPYKRVDTSKLPEAQPYPDGEYRGVYAEGDQTEIVVLFSVRDNRIENIVYEELAYEGEDYLSAQAPQEIAAVCGQFRQMIDYLVGKEIVCVNDLYEPASIVSDTDAASGATIRSPKLISAIWNGLNQGSFHVY